MWGAASRRSRWRGRRRRTRHRRWRRPCLRIDVAAALGQLLVIWDHGAARRRAIRDHAPARRNSPRRPGSHANPSVSYVPVPSPCTAASDVRSIAKSDACYCRAASRGSSICRLPAAPPCHHGGTPPRGMATSNGFICGEPMVVRLREGISRH